MLKLFTRDDELVQQDVGRCHLLQQIVEAGLKS